MKRKKSDCENGRHNHFNWNGGEAPPPPPSSPSSRSQRLNSEETDDSSAYGEAAVQHHQQQPANLPTQPAENVPIFALHPKGAFYVPMSIELALIRALFNPPSTENAQSLLHPVTISVNFCHPLRVLTAAVAVANAETSAAPPSHPVHHSSVIQPPARIPRPEVLLSGLVPVPPPTVHQRHHQHPFEMESTGSNCYPLPIEDGSRIRSREHGRSSLPRHHDDLKMFRTPQRDEAAYNNGIESRRHEYAIIRSSREHGSRSPAVITTTATHSSRWSHLMAKRTHTPWELTLNNHIDGVSKKTTRVTIF